LWKQHRQQQAQQHVQQHERSRNEEAALIAMMNTKSPRANLDITCCYSNK
jgi:hypothetical protein